MNILVRLERLERRVSSGKMEPAVSFIMPDGDGYRLEFAVWDGIIGSGERKTVSSHPSRQAALAEYYQLLIHHHIKKDAPLIILDI